MVTDDDLDQEVDIDNKGACMDKSLAIFLLTLKLSVAIEGFALLILLATGTIMQPKKPTHCCSLQTREAEEFLPDHIVSVAEICEKDFDPYYQTYITKCKDDVRRVKNYRSFTSLTYVGPK